MREKIKTHNFSNIFILTLLMCVYFVYAIGLFLRVGIDSDYSNLVLEATDILNGNVFLEDWNLTGISFATTDLLFFVIGVLFGGTTINAYYIAVILMFFVLILGAILLTKCNDVPFSYIDFLIIVAVGGLPTIYGINVIRAHTAAAAYVLFAFYFLLKANNNENKKNYLYYFLIILFLSLGIAGDAITLIIGIAPIIIINLIYLFQKNKLSNKKKIINILISVFSLILGKIIDKIIISIGKTNKNEFLEGKFFGSFDELSERFKIVIQSLLGMYNADFTNQKLLSITSLWYFLRIILLIFVIYLIINNLIKIIKKKEFDSICAAISIGFILMTILMITTDIVGDTLSARYIGYFPIFSSVLIIRYLKNKKIYETRLLNINVSKKYALLFCSILFIFSSLQGVDFKREEQPQRNLAAFLEEKGLTNGYAKFWNASHVTVASNNKVKVRAIVFDGQRHMAQFNWFCKNSWYYEDTNFVVVENNEPLTDHFQITKENVVKSFGKPSQVLEYDIYTIYVYKNTLSDRIIKNVLEG